MDCKCETCVRKDCPDRTRQDDLRIIIVCDDYMEQERKMTNADRIRAMSDEDLARYMAELIDNIDSQTCCYSNIPDEWLSWLQQTAEVE